MSLEPVSKRRPYGSWKVIENVGYVHYTTNIVRYLNFKTRKTLQIYDSKIKIFQVLFQTLFALAERSKLSIVSSFIVLIHKVNIKFHIIKFFIIFNTNLLNILTL